MTMIFACLTGEIAWLQLIRSVLTAISAIWPRPSRHRAAQCPGCGPVIYITTLICLPPAAGSLSDP